MKKIVSIILMLLIIMTSCTKPKEMPEPELVPEPPAPPTIQERVEKADYTVIAGKWCYIFGDGYERVEDASVASLYTTGEKIYDATEFTGEDAAFNFASAVVAKKPSAIAYAWGCEIRYAFFDGECFYYNTDDMIAYHLDIQADKFKDPYTFEEWNLCAAEVRKSTGRGYDTSFVYSFATLSAEKGAEIGFETSGRLVSVRE